MTPAKRSNLKLGLLFAAGLVILGGAVAGRALAQEGFGHFGHGAKAAFIHRMIGKHIDEALDAAKVSDRQRTAIHEVRDRTFEKLMAQHQGKDRGAEVERVLSVFTGDRIDPQEVAALRAEHEAEMKQAGDTITEALTEVHDILTPAQRQAVAGYVRAHHQGADAPHGQN
jgi:Spy/CpxP family protein refolding chaperone